MAVTKGTYRHYKGNRYEVIGTGTHTETDERFVVYRPLYDSATELWIRPITMFEETVLVDGKTVPRFTREDASSDGDAEAYTKQ